MENWIGKTYTFSDGGTIKILQIKHREDGPWVHYLIGMNDCLPRKLVMPQSEFEKNFIHLYNPTNNNTD
jgi:hypothetical protein